MKLQSGRSQDVHDVAAIILLKKISSPEELVEQLLKYGFSRIDESLILEAFGEAYGMAWLEKNYIENEEHPFSVSDMFYNPQQQNPKKPKW